jgi:thioredoxin reductase (NADPH)
VNPHYDCIVIGGGIAGLQGAIQLGRYKHKVLVIDKGCGRSTLCNSYHNILGWPDGISGEELRRLGKIQAERLDVAFKTDEVIRLVQDQEKQGFRIEVKEHDEHDFYTADTLLLATGVLDRFPKLSGLEACFGYSVYVCPDCDGYETSGHRTIVMGSGDVGANMALTLLYWTTDIIYLNHEAGQNPVSEAIMEQLREKAIIYYEVPIDEIIADEKGMLKSVRLSDGSEISGERGFIAFGGNKVHTELAAQLRVERLENKHIVTDPRSKMTSVPGVWAAGDIGVHAEQVTIAMGEGAQAAIWIHKQLLKKKAPSELSRQR